MLSRYRWTIFTAALILALLFSVFPLGAVKAEGEDPAPTDTPVTETQPAATEEQPAGGGASSPPAEETSPTVEEVIAQVPDGVTVVPLDPIGQTLTMAEKGTAEANVTGDPVYCPMNVLFGNPLCEHYITIDEAINRSMMADFGTVYVEVDYSDSNPAPIIIDGSYGQDFPQQFSLIGGVDISTGEIVGRTKLSRQIIVSYVPIFNFENFSVTLPEVILPGPNAPIVEAAPAAFFIDSTGNININDSDFNNNPGPGIAINTTGMVSLYNVQANNNGSGNVIANQAGDVFLTHSQFNGNQGTGLDVTTSGNIFAVCNQAKNNAGVDARFPEIGSGGMYLQAAGDITVWCSKVKGNSSYGLIADTLTGNITVASNNFSGNELIDFVPLSENPLIEQTAPCSEICPSCKGGGSGEEEKPTEGNTQVVIVKVGEGDGTAEIKPGYSTVFKLFDQERLVQLTALTSGSAPSGSTALYTPLDEGTLPAPLPEGASLIPWGFNLSLTNPDGTPVESLIGYMLVRFYLPEGFVLPGGMRVVIQYYDPATSSWEPMSTAVGGGTAFTYATKPGSYVLTMEPIE